MSLENMQNRAVEIAELYDQLNQAERGISWSDGDYVAGLVGDVGDLSKISMAREGLRQMDDVDTKFEHELHDVLWSALVLAARNKLNLEAGFMLTMDQLEAKVRAQLDATHPEPPTV